LKNCKLSREEAYAALARLYFQWIGPATPAEFQWFSGLGVKTAADALASLGLVPLETGSDRLLFPHDLDALWSFKTPADPVYRLVSSLDSLVLLRRDHRSLMDPADLDRSLELAHGPASLWSLADLPSHAILDRGRLVGLWDYDPASESIVCFNFIQLNMDLDAAIKNTEDYVRIQLGDARSFSLDSPKSRLRRLAALRQAAG
jgi:hypothetical protein